MARTQLTAYVPADLADAVKRVAAADDRSISDIIEDALIQRLLVQGLASEQAAIMAKLQHLDRRLAAMWRIQEALHEFFVQQEFVSMRQEELSSGSIDPAEASRLARERLRERLLHQMGKITEGRSVWQNLCDELAETRS
jgi:hypothetical protein